MFPQSAGQSPKSTFPGAIADTIQPVLDYYGWHRYAEVRQAAVDSAAAAASVLWLVDGTAVVPDNTLRVLIALSCHHDDVAVNHTLQFEVIHGAADPVGIGEGSAVRTTLEMLTLPYPIVLWPATQIQCRSLDVMGAGDVLTIRGLFVDVPIGEVFRP